MTNGTQRPLVGLVDSVDAAKYLAIGERTFRRLVADGKIPRRRIGALVRYRVSDLDAFIESLSDSPSLRVSNLSAKVS